MGPQDCVAALYGVSRYIKVPVNLGICRFIAYVTLVALTPCGLLWPLWPFLVLGGLGPLVCNGLCGLSVASVAFRSPRFPYCLFLLGVARWGHLCWARCRWGVGGWRPGCVLIW